MKVMNEIKAPIDGVVLEILGRNGEMVAYDQPLVRLGDAV
jgi:biotin carboxyl carrier protein